MKSEYFNKMEQSRIDYFKKIKFNENPNPFKSRVEEVSEKMNATVIEEVALKPLLQVQRLHVHYKENVAEETLTPLLPVKQAYIHIYTEDKDEEDGDFMMETLGSIRIKNFLNRCYERVVKAFYLWFEIELPMA